VTAPARPLRIRINSVATVRSCDTPRLLALPRGENGMASVLEEDGDEETKKFAPDLIKKSARPASAGLQFCRLPSGRRLRGRAGRHR